MTYIAVVIGNAGIVFVFIIIVRSQRSNSKPSIPREILLWLHDGMDCETCGLDSPKANIMPTQSQKNIWNQRSKEWEPLTKGLIAGRGIAHTIPPPKRPKERIIIDHPIEACWCSCSEGISTVNEIRTRKVYR